MSGDLTEPWARLDTSDFRLRVGAGAPILGSGRWKLAGAVASTVRGTNGYSQPDGNIRAGISFGRHGLVVRLGQLRDIAGTQPLLPFYGTLTFGTRW